jgi:hypothetical protein
MPTVVGTFGRYRLRRWREPAITGPHEEVCGMDERAKIVVGVDGSAGSREALRFRPGGRNPP